MKLQQFYNHLIGLSEAPERIIAAGLLDNQQALQVYRDGYTARLTEALGETYLTIWKFLGDEDFFTVARNYIECHPSHTYNISHYGLDFPKFLARNAFGVSFPYLQDLANLDWLRAHLFHQRTEVGLDAVALTSHLTAQFAANKRIIFSSSFLFFVSKYSVFQLWTSINKGLALDQDPESPETICVFKRDNLVFFQSLPMACFPPLDRLQCGSTIEAALHDLDDVPTQQLFRFLSENRLIRDLA